MDGVHNTDVWDYVQVPKANFDERSYELSHVERFALVHTMIQDIEAAKILDIGIQVGTFYKTLPHKATYDIHGVDVVPEFIPILKNRGIEGILCNINNDTLPYADGVFDLILCDSLLEHSLNPKHLLSEINRVLKPGGKLLIVVPNGVSVRRRWGALRGLNPFEPLIDNLFNRTYLRRCSIFYSSIELDKILAKDFKLSSITYINDTYPDEHKFAIRVCRLISRGIPRMKDGICALYEKY